MPPAKTALHRRAPAIWLRRLWVGWALAHAGFAGALEQPSAASPAPQVPIRVGFIGPLTGGSADFGNSARLGVAVAIQEINQLGGYLGRRFEMVSRDDRSDPAAGRQAAIDLVDKEHVDFSIGYCNTGVALRSIDVFEARRSILVVPCSTGTQVTHQVAASRSFVFRVAPTDAMTARFLVDDIVVRRKLRKVALLADATGYGDGGVHDVVAELKSHGLVPVYQARFALGTLELSEPMRAAKAAGAEALIVYAVGPEQAAAVKARAALRWKVPYLAPWPLSFRSVLERAGAPALEDTMMAQTVIQDNGNERRSSFLARYSKVSGEERIGSFMAAAQAYDATHLLLRALFASHGDTSGVALKAQLESLQEPYRGVVTTYDKPFSPEDHDAYSERMLWLGAWRGGDIKFVYPEDARLSSVFRRKAGY